MMKFFRNQNGAAALEFAFVAPVLFSFFIGIMQTGYVLWIDNLLRYSVDVAARCGAIQSTTPLCSNPVSMTNTANALFAMAGTGRNPTYTSNCSSGLSGFTATYQVSILGVTGLTLTAKSCYPTYP